MKFISSIYCVKSYNIIEDYMSVLDYKYWKIPIRSLYSIIYADYLLVITLSGNNLSAAIKKPSIGDAVTIL